jgi:hypothetical protein
MKTRIAVFICAACAVAPPAVAADGLPVTGLDGRVGVISPDGTYRIVTFITGSHTEVARLHTDGAEIARSRTIPGTYAVPAVAYDSSASGLSHDGRTLVLIRPRRQIPSKRTSLAVLDAQRFLVRKTITLKGEFSVDAVSPDGGRVYLIQYQALSRHGFDPTKYAVRSLNVQTGKLDPAPIIDPREPDDKMGGLPVTRMMSADGRWAYTFYSGGAHPFIHALDTVGRTARCVDLDALAKRQDLFQLRLRLARGGHELQVVDGRRRPVALMDTQTFRISAPSAAKPRPAVAPAPSRTDQSGGKTLWPYAAVAAILLALLAFTLRPLARASRAR